MAFLLLLERLTPVERAVFLLHDVFDYDYDEVARHRRQERGQLPPARGARPPARRRAPAAVRGLAAPARRARRALLRRGRGRRHGRPRRAARRGRRGPTATAAARCRRGRTRSSAATASPAAARHRPASRASSGSPSGAAEINGQPGARFLDPTGGSCRDDASTSPTAVVQTIRSVINPDKLRHLGPLADVRALMHDRAERRR